MSVEKQYQWMEATSVSEIQHVYGTLNLELGQCDNFGFDLVWFFHNSLQYRFLSPLSLWTCCSFCPRTSPPILSFDLLCSMECLLESSHDLQDWVKCPPASSWRHMCSPLALPVWSRIVRPCLLLLTFLWHCRGTFCTIYPHYPAWYQT